MSDVSVDRTRRVRPVLEYPCGEPPAAGAVTEVATGVLWIRMPLPFSLANINLWAIRDGEQWAIVDTGIQTAASSGYSIPDFWLGQLLILTFAIGLGWLPSQGNSSVRDASTGLAGWLDHMRYLILPAFALSLRYLALITRITRASMLEVMGSDYILAARSRGASEWTVVVVHGLRNAAAPVLTVIGYNVGFILAGSALIEAVFAWPGIGRLLFESISKRDYPVMLAILLMVSATVVVANLVTDIVHRLIDPRIERQ